MTSRTWLIVAVKVVAVAAALLIPAMPQPIAYHDFADHRDLFGIHNFLDVASNGAFLIVGIIGLAVTLGRRAQFEFTLERLPYVVFFVGVTLTAAGSAYYHLHPDNETLFWMMLTRRTLIGRAPDRATQPAAPVAPGSVPPSSGALI